MINEWIYAEWHAFKKRKRYIYLRFDKKDYQRIKGSHKVNANSNSAPSWACVRRWHISVHIEFRCMRAITEFSETRSMLQPLESHFLPLKLPILSFYCSLFYPFCLYAVKIYSVIFLRHLNSIISYFALFSISNIFTMSSRSWLSKIIFL